MPQKPLPLIISLKHWREQNGFSQSDAVKVLKNTGIPVPRPSRNSEPSKASLAPMPSTPPQARNCPSTFRPPSALWTNPGNQATSEAPMEPSASTRFKPKNMTDAALSVGQSYKDFFVVGD